MDDIRAAVPGDADAIAAVHVTAWRETYAGLVPTGMLAAMTFERRAAHWRRVLAASAVSEWVHVAEADGAIVGFGSCGPQRSDTLAGLGYDAEIYAVYVLESRHGRGLGSRLMAAMSRDLQERALRSASLWVLTANERAARFYSRLGGAVVAQQESVRPGVILQETAYGWRDRPILPVS